MKLWSEVATGESTRTPIISGTSVRSNSIIPSSMCVGCVTICPQPYDCYYKSWQLWLHNIHTHNCAVCMPKGITHVNSQPLKLINLTPEQLHRSTITWNREIGNVAPGRDKSFRTNNHTRHDLREALGPGFSPLPKTSIVSSN